MKNRKILIIILGIIGIVIAFILFFTNLKNDSNENTNNISNKTLTAFKLKNTSIKMLAGYYVLETYITKVEDEKFNHDDYAIYILDKDNNLLYSIDGSEIGSFDSYYSDIMVLKNIDKNIENYDKVVLINKKYGYKINKDIRNSIETISNEAVHAVGQ